MTLKDADRMANSVDPDPVQENNGFCKQRFAHFYQSVNDFYKHYSNVIKCIVFRISIKLGNTARKCPFRQNFNYLGNKFNLKD